MPEAAAAELDPLSEPMGSQGEERPSLINLRLMPNPGSRPIESPDFTAFCQRILEALGRRVANGDVEDLKQLISLRGCLEETIRTAVLGLHQQGYSWSTIGEGLGDITPQAAHKRYARTEGTDG